MRVNFLLGSFPRNPSGGALVVYQYANGLAQLGHEVTITYARRMPTWESFRGTTLSQRVRGAARGVLDAFSDCRPDWFELDVRVRVESLPEYDANRLVNADVVVATFWPTAEFASGLPAGKGKPIYLIQHLEDWAGPRERVLDTWRLPMTKVTVARWLYREGLRMGLSSSELAYVPNAVEHDVFHQASPIETRRPHVAFMYSRATWKGAADAIAALESARAEMPTLKATSYGVWRRPDELPEWIDYVRAPSREQLVTGILNKASIFLCSSWSEGWGLPGAEASACGCALVSTDNGGVRDYAVQGTTALLSEPKDVSALASNVISLLKDDARRVEIAQAGRKNVLDFHWERSIASFEHVLMREITSTRGEFLACSVA